MLTLIINAEDSEKDGIISDIKSGSVSAIPNHFNGDGEVDIHIREVRALENSAIPFTEAYEDGDEYLVSVGNVDDKPTGGTFIIDIDGHVTSALQYDSTAAQIQDALSGASNAAGYGSVGVTELAEGNFEIEWGTVGAVPEITIDGTYLRPVCEIEINRFRVGGGSQKAMQTFSVKRAAVASATVSTPYISDNWDITVAQAGTDANNAKADIFFGTAYAGSMTATLTADGVASVVTLAPTMTLAEIGAALTSHPSIYYQTPEQADNVLITQIDDIIRVEFIGTQSGAALTRTIASNTAANPTAITTSTDHGYAVGQVVTIPANNGSSASIAGTHTITEVVSATTFIIAINCTGSGGTGGTVYTSPSLTFLADSTLVYALGNTGTLNFSTEALAREFLATTEDSLPFLLQVKRLRGADARTILSAPVTLYRNLINGDTLSAPDGIVSAFVKKTELGTNVFTFLGAPSSANLRAALTDETGTGAAVFATGPTITLTNCTGLPVSTGISGLGTGVATALAVNIGSAGAAVTFNGAGGTPSSLTLTNATGLPVTTGISGLGTGVATLLSTYATSSSTNRFSVVGPNAAESLRLAGSSGGGCYLQTFSNVSAYMTQSAYYDGAAWRKTGGGTSAVLFGAFNGVIRLYTDSGISVSDGTSFTPTERFSMDGAGATFSVPLYVAKETIFTPQALSGAGAVNLTTTATDFTSTGAAQDLTLANGTSGQIKTITHIFDGGSGVLTPTTKTGYTTITFTNAGDSVTLRYCTTAGWCVIGSFGVTIA